MTKSRKAEVNITQATLTGQNAQNTADEAASGVTNLNDPNMMSVIEKQTNIGQFAGLTSQYNVIVQDAKDDGIDTTDLTVAYNNLNQFMANVLTDPDHASDVDRVTYKKYQDAYNQELSNIQSAFQNNANNRFASAASATSQAASTANAAKSAADSAYDYASSEMTVQSNATDKAQSAADSASSQAIKAIDTGNVTSQAVTDLKDGSTMTIAQLQNGLESKVSNSEYASYKWQTASQIGELVTDGTFSAYSQATAGLISSKVSNSDFSSYKDETATVIDSKVASSAFDTYKEQTAATISSKVDNGDFSTYKTQTANDINLRVTEKGLIDQINMQAGNTLILSSGQLTLSSKNIYFDSVNPVIIPNANIDTVLVNKNLQAADIEANTFTTNNKTFTVDKYGAVVASNLTIRGVTNLAYNAALLGSSWFSVPGWSLTNQGFCGLNIAHDGVKSIGINNTVTGWTLFAQTKLYPLNGVTGQSFSASVWFLEFGSDTSLQYQFTLAFFDSNGNRLDGGFVGNTWNGIGSRQDWRYVTIDNAVAPSNAVSVGLQYWSYNGHCNAYFSSPMLTQTAQSTGYQPDTGNVVSAGEIDGTVINGSTINGTTFNAGSKLNQYGNTSYPLTINSDGSVTSTSFGNIANDPAALRTVIKDGMVETNFRGMNQISTGIYPAADVALGAGQLALFAGYSTSQVPNFSATSLNNTGYVILNANTGLSLHGDTQNIYFNGLSTDITPKGIAFTPYGNINATGTQGTWYLGHDRNSQTANFGIDSAGINEIYFKRQVNVGAVTVSTGGTFALSNGGDFWFGKTTGGFTSIHAGAVHYTSLVKSSLLSVKKNVQKADTAYWAQLVNSIDLATYQYKSDDNTSHIRLSSIVDDVNDDKQWQLPDVFINRDKDGKLDGVDDSVLLNATLATVQEQQKEIDQLNGHNMELEARLNKLEAKING